MPSDNDFDLEDLDSFSFEDEVNESAAADSAAGDAAGVWVKSGPVDVAEGAGSAKTADPLEDEVDFLSSEELAKLDDQFDFVVQETPMEGESLEDDAVAMESLDLPDLDVPAPTAPAPELATEDFAIDDLGDVEAAPAEGDGSFDEISLDDFVSFDDEGDSGAVLKKPSEDSPSGLPTEDDLNEEFLDIDIEIEDEIDDHELEILSGAKIVRDEPPAVAPVAGAEEIDLSEFGDFGLDEAVTEFIPEAPDAEGSAAPETAAPSLNEGETFTELGAIDTEGFFEQEIVLDDEPAGEPAPASDFDVSFDEVLAEEKDLPAELEVPVQAEPDIDRILELEDKLTSGIKQAQTVAATGGVDASAILLKIEQELSTIKSEITDLKKEVTNLRSPDAQAAPAAKDSKQAKTGFFDEEDDEVIALTGDELDNILNSAEITEEESAAEDLSDFDASEDLLATDAEGNLVTTPPEDLLNDENTLTSDEDLFAGTSLEDSPNDEVHVPETDIAVPLSADTIPESIELEDTLPEFVDQDEKVDNLASAAPSDGELSIELDETFGGITEEIVDESEFFSSTPAPASEEDHSLDIPLDDEITLEDDMGLEDSAPEAASVSDDFDFEEYAESTPAVPAAEPVPAPQPVPEVAPLAAAAGGEGPMPDSLKTELKTVLAYMDKLLGSLPDDKIQEFAQSSHFEVYKKLFEQLGLMEQ